MSFLSCCCLSGSIRIDEKKWYTCDNACCQLVLTVATCWSVIQRPKAKFHARKMDALSGLLHHSWWSNCILSRMYLSPDLRKLVVLIVGTAEVQSKMCLEWSRKRMDVSEIPRSVAVLPCHLGWRTLLKCNKTNHAILVTDMVIVMGYITWVKFSRSTTHAYMSLHTQGTRMQIGAGRSMHF